MPTVDEKLLRLLRNGVVIVFACALLAGLFVPVYTDEIGWRFQERAAIDGVDKLFSDLCGPNTLAVPPWFMMPVRYFSAYLNLWFADPIYVRLSGILYALAWLVMLLALLQRITVGGRQQVVLGLWAVGLLGLANLPLLLVWSRPDQPVMLSALAAMLLACDRRSADAEQAGQDTGAVVAWWRSLAILALATVAFSYHLKTLFLVPVFLACLWLASRGRAALPQRILASALLAAMASSSLSYWVSRMQCGGDTVLRAKYAGSNVGADLSGVHGVSGLFDLVGRMLGNISFWHYIELTVPTSGPMSYWLPPDQVSVQAAFVWLAFLTFVWGAVALLAVIALARGVAPAFRRRRLDGRLLLSLLLIAAVTAWSATQNWRNVYEASFVVPLLMLSVVLALSAVELGERTTRYRDILAGLVGLGAIVSIAVVVLLWAPSLTHANMQSGYIANQPNSVPVFGYAAQEPDILAAARQCRIPPPGKAKGLLVDELTYFTFMESPLPQHRLGVLGVWKGSISDPVAYLRSRGSDGMIIGCHYLPPDLRARAGKRGRFCCLGPPNW